jgi:thiol:disulfide interchange protein DsbD
MAQRILTLILLLCSTSAFAGLFDAPGRSNFVPADQAFVFDFQQNQHELNLNWTVKQGFYLYRKQISITPAEASVGEPTLPAGEWHEDEFYGKSEIYRQQLTVPVTINQAAKGATLTVTYQGCADAGLCYPPETKVVPLSEVQAAALAPSAPAKSTSVPAPKSELPFSALWALLIGIGIAFTPCVLAIGAGAVANNTGDVALGASFFSSCAGAAAAAPSAESKIMISLPVSVLSPTETLISLTIPA